MGAPEAVHAWSLWTTTARLVVTRPETIAAARALVEAHLAEVERAASRFRDDSELRTLTPDADGLVTLSPLLADLLLTALDAARETDGLVDPTVAAALAGLGYDRDIRLVALDPDAGRLRATVRPVPGWRRLALVPGPAGVRLRVPEGVDAGTLLDLGATAKARAADVAARLVADRLGTGVLLSLGGDLATAGPDPVGGWQVRVADHPDDPEQTVRLGAGWAVATSSTVRRTWRRAEGPQHHVVDPRTGRSADPVWRTVTVAAPTCTAANTAATAAVVLGVQAPDWLAARGVAARLVDRAHRVHRVGAWPEAEEVAA